MLEVIIVILAFIILGLGYQLRRQQKQVVGNQSNSISHLQRITDLQERLLSQEQKLEEAQKKMTRCDGLILQLRQEISQRDSGISTLQKMLHEHQVINHDLNTQIRSTERDSLQSKALFSAISNVSYDLVFVLDEDFVIIALNKSADILFGQTNPIGERLIEVLDVPELMDIIERAFTEPDSLEEQIVIDRHFYRVRTQVMRYEGAHVFIGVAMQDITQLVRLNRARRDMVANISHELRTPIANIRLIIEGLFHEHERPKRKASIASLRDIAHETDSLLRLVQELLDLSMIESGQAIMKLYPTALQALVGQTIERLSEQLATKQLHVLPYVPQRLHVLCDPEQTQRVLTNLIRNAIKWSPMGDTITVSAIDDGEDVTVSIFDNGPGVPDDQVERIFERFYQVDPARSGGEGSGLGLAICKHIIEAHGGRIWAEGNRKGNGGRFFFTLLSAAESSADMLDDMPMPMMTSSLRLPDEAHESPMLLDDWGEDDQEEATSVPSGMVEVSQEAADKDHNEDIL